MRALDWQQWRVTKKVEDAQRRDLGLPARPPWRHDASPAGQIQAYEQLCFPGLAAEWAEG